MTRLVSWGGPIFVQALILGAIVSLIALPIIALYRKKKNLPLRGRWLWLAPLLILYGTGVIAFTFLPLPARDQVQCHLANTLYYTRYFMGWSLDFAFRNTQGLGIARFASWWFVQIYLNVLLFVPWGLAARYFFKFSFRTTLYSTFAISLFIELTQLTGLWGYYGCRYRTFDVDDLITNTLGGIIGWLLVELVSRYFSPALLEKARK